MKYQDVSNSEWRTVKARVVPPRPPARSLARYQSGETEIEPRRRALHIAPSPTVREETRSGSESRTQVASIDSQYAARTARQIKNRVLSRAATEHSVFITREELPFLTSEEISSLLDEGRSLVEESRVERAVLANQASQEMLARVVIHNEGANIFTLSAIEMDTLTTNDLLSAVYTWRKGCKGVKKCK